MRASHGMPCLAGTTRLKQRREIRKTTASTQPRAQTTAEGKTEREAESAGRIDRPFGFEVWIRRIAAHPHEFAFQGWRIIRIAAINDAVDTRNYGYEIVFSTKPILRRPRIDVENRSQAGNDRDHANQRLYAAMFQTERPLLLHLLQNSSTSSAASCWDTPGLTSSVVVPLRSTGSSASIAPLDRAPDTKGAQ